MADLGDDVAFATLGELGAGLRGGDYTALELSEFFLRRAGELGPRLNAVVTLTADLALLQAERADRELAQGLDRGPLHGIPYGAKDLLATAGIPTSWGAGPLADQLFDRDAAVIERLRDAGAVLVAKLSMVEIAGGLGYRQPHASFTGPGRNPWNPAHWSGGSSSGSGAAVAAAIVPFAIGSETWGSIMSPAANCGVAGLRPTYGRVSRRGAMALSWTMDKIGPLARTAEDCAHVLAAIAGPDALDASCANRPFAYPPPAPPTGPFRVGILADGVELMQGEVERNFRRALGVLTDLVELVVIELPDELPCEAAAGTIIACEMASAFEPLLAQGTLWEMTAPEDRTGAHAAQFIPARDYLQALRIRTHVQRRFDELLAPLDAVATPTRASVASRIEGDSPGGGRYRSSMLSAAENLAGLPGISVPTGFDDAGLPTAMRFTARAWDEHRVVALARAYQDRTDWHRRRPPL